jgi:hypothetical protein
MAITKTLEEVNKIIEEKYSHYDEEGKERLRKFLLTPVKETTFYTTVEQNKAIAKAIDGCPCCKSRSKFAENYLGTNSQDLYRKLKGLRRFTVREITIIEEHFDIVLR